MTHCYDERYERPDFALINSFFLPGHGKDLLASVDLPGGYLGGGPYAHPDSEHFPMWSLEAEAARLEQRLAAFPTTEAQVKPARGSYTSWPCLAQAAASTSTTTSNRGWRQHLAASVTEGGPSPM